MKYARDILLIDIETTGADPHKDFPLQIAAVLLDKDNLLEKANFNSYVRFPFAQETNDRIVKTLGIPKEQWMKSPNLKTVLAAFTEKFPYHVTLASHNMINLNFLREAFRKANMPYEYDYHVLDLWTLGYFFLLRQNIKKIPTAETVGQFFKIPKGNEHNALENCRYLAEILRKLSKQ